MNKYCMFYVYHVCVVGVGGGRWMRFDPSAYAENKRRQRKDSHERIQSVAFTPYYVYTRVYFTTHTHTHIHTHTQH